jgi:molybdopterin-guanine dinucleotide biosynthesis protein MobB
MKRLHIVGRKNSGKTTLIVELVNELTGCGVKVGTIKHTHHRHELDVPGKDSYRHRAAGAAVVGILSPAMSAIFMPSSGAHSLERNRYDKFAPMFAQCELVLVEGDSQTTAPKIEVWRKELNTAPLANEDTSILAVVTDDPLSVAMDVLPRSDIAGLSTWIMAQTR